MNKFCGLEVLFSNVHPSNEGMILQEENGRHSFRVIPAHVGSPSFRDFLIGELVLFLKKHQTMPQQIILPESRRSLIAVAALCSRTIA